MCVQAWSSMAQMTGFIKAAERAGDAGVGMVNGRTEPRRSHWVASADTETGTASALHAELH